MRKMEQRAADEVPAELLDMLPAGLRQRAADRWRIARLRERPGIGARLALFLTLMGPGLLVMIGDNDAGGVLTYAQTGAAYGLGFFVPFLLLMTPVAYIVQEMTVRLGAVTGRGHAEMIWGRYGTFWGAFSLIDLVVANILTLVTEFIGVRTALAIFGVPGWLAVTATLVVVASVLLFLKYYTWERVALWLALFNVVFVPLAFAAHPQWADVGRALKTWALPPGTVFGPFLYVVLANVGTTIAPWMVFFQQSSVVDKGLTVSDIRHGQVDTAVGSIVMSLIAVAILVLTATLGGDTGPHHQFELTALLARLGASSIGRAGVALFALGLLEAGLVAAIAITASTSWAVGEALGLPRSINLPPGQGIAFYFSGIASAAIAALLVLAPGAPLGLLNLTVQVVASIFMPAAMLFLLLLLNDSEIMGVHVNRPWQNIAAVTIIGLLVVANGLYGYSVLFPGGRM